MSKTKAAASNKAAATTTRVPYSKPLLRRSLWRESIVDTLLAHVPARFGRFIDPFVGRAELFFALAPKEAILSDNNPEVINLYQQVAHNVDALLTHLKSYEHSEECYKRLCAQRFVDLEPAEAAARTLYLNKNCFHGVYRVDNEGRFLTPYGNYLRRNTVDEKAICHAAAILSHATIISGDFCEVVTRYAQKGDLVFLDPPYMRLIWPFALGGSSHAGTNNGCCSGSSTSSSNTNTSTSTSIANGSDNFSSSSSGAETNFKLYEQIKLAHLLRVLYARGCHVLLTNSSHPLLAQLYAPFEIEYIPTKRRIYDKRSPTTTEDILVYIKPVSYRCSPIQAAASSTSDSDVGSKASSAAVRKQQTLAAALAFDVDLVRGLDMSALRYQRRLFPELVSAQVALYPPTRYMGSKSKLVFEIWQVASRFACNSILDLFSGSGVVSYLFKAQGKRVVSNDYLHMAYFFAKALVENNKETLPLSEAQTLLEPLAHAVPNDHFVATTFKDLYFSDEDNALIDVLRCNIATLKDNAPYKHAIAMSALIRACIKKRPRGIFTYVGNRYDDGRKDLQLSLAQHFLDAVDVINKAVFDNGQDNVALRGDAMSLGLLPLMRSQNANLQENQQQQSLVDCDLVYLDPPYFSALSDNGYVRRYHFVEGLACNWQGLEIQEHTNTKKFKAYPTPFSHKKSAVQALSKLFERYQDRILIVSYSSNSIPTKENMLALLRRYKPHVKVVPIDYQYHIGNNAPEGNSNNEVQEYLFVGY